MLHFKFCLSLNIAIFDAGSTGTRLKIFDFQNEKLQGEIKYKSNGGIHEKNEHQIENEIESFKTIINHYEDDIKIGFYGTAGFRMILKNKQNQILKIIKNKLKNFTELKIISGLEEAFYTLKAFEYYFPNEDDFIIVDMGGRSVQLIYKKDGIVKMNSLEMGILNSECNNENRIKKESHDKGFHGYEKESHDYEKESHDYEKESHDYGKGFQDYEKESHDYEKESHDYGKEFQDYEKESHDYETSCIDSFFKNQNIEKLNKTKKVYLISFYEEIIDQTEDSLEMIFERFILTCNQNFNNENFNNKKFDNQNSNNKNSSKECQKKYYSLRFLEEIGIQRDTPIVLINNKLNVDISWSLGKALELSKLS